MPSPSRPKILLVNPPIYDFAAYDFWLKPYGLLAVAGFLQDRADLALFDYLDRLHPALAGNQSRKSDRWGRGRFPAERIARPACLQSIPRYYRRFGLPRPLFRRFLAARGPFDFALMQVTMTYWYPGAREVIEDIRRFAPSARIVLGGNYPTLCPEHAATLGADLVVSGTDLAPLWSFLDIQPDTARPALWQAYPALDVGVLKLSDGCPFRCTYCSVPKVYGRFEPRPRDRALAELDLLRRLGANNIAFYDDALLFDAENTLAPFLEHAAARGPNNNFHSPNALNARFLTPELAQLMVRAGFKTFYLGFESGSPRWQQRTGSKVYSEELAAAVANLLAAGAHPNEITAYQILGHPRSDAQNLEASMHFVHSLGIRGMLADFSPLPQTPDGQACRKWIDLEEPLMHNKTAFTITRLGFERTNYLKDLQRRLNRSLPACP